MYFESTENLEHPVSKAVLGLQQDFEYMTTTERIANLAQLSSIVSMLLEREFGAAEYQNCQARDVLIAMGISD